ncbi:MAG: hypothetical protein AAF902_12215 [Chloroflexota bacterium]
MNFSLTAENRKLIIILITSIFVFMVLCGATAIISWRIDRMAAQMPNSEVISSHNKYSLPRLYRWDDTYTTQTEIDDVYRWYSITFNLGAEKQANGSCSLLEDMKSTFIGERYMGVFICEMGDQRMIFVNRSTKLFP